MVYTGTSNTMETRALPAIVLKQANIFRGYYFLLLETYKTIHGNKWQVQPMNDRVIDAVHDLADNKNQPIMSRGGPIFDVEPMNVEEVEEDDDDEIEENVRRNKEVMFEAPVISDSNEASIAEEDFDLEEDDVESTSGNNQGELNVVERDDTSTSETSLNDLSKEENNFDTGSVEEKMEVDDASLRTPSTDSECNLEETYTNESDTSYQVEDEEETSLEESMPRASRPRRYNAGAGISRLEPTLRGKTHEETTSKQCMMCKYAVTKNWCM